MSLKWRKRGGQKRSRKLRRSPYLKNTERGIIGRNEGEMRRKGEL